jgi:pimeloyl-ACP methyl ester carboxylesterase
MRTSSCCALTCAPSCRGAACSARIPANAPGYIPTSADDCIPTSATRAATTSRARTARAISQLALVTLTASALLALSGCVVPQPRGEGKLARLVEPSSERGFWLYLPKNYLESGEAELKARRWPIVVSFHGMKPFDVSYYQACEWQQEADRYGYIVISPELLAPNVLHEFPMRKIIPELRTDEDATLAILDHVVQTTEADPTHVLATSWSSGGYMAHYMVNRHPERFTALAVRQSNFCPDLLDESLAPRSRYHPILIVNTENDFPICKEESRTAIEWYNARGFKNVAWVMIRHLAHERTPDMAADFFGRVCQIQPNRPPTMLVRRQAIDGNVEGMALLRGTLSVFQAPAPREVPRTARVATEARRIPAPEAEPRDDVKASAIPQRPAGPPTPERGTRPARPTAAREVSIRVSPRTGIEPLFFNYAAECPADWRGTAHFEWSLNGETIGREINGQKSIAQPGDHTLELTVTTADGLEHRALQTIRVIPRLRADAGQPIR